LNACGLTSDIIRRIARQTGFCQRASGKIDVIDFLNQFCEESVKGTVSYNDLAAKMQAATSVSASRQAYGQRIHADVCVALFQTVLATLILSKLNARVLKRCRLFKRILIQDSTIIQLPSRLFDLFSGVKNAHTTTCNARIQGVYDLCSGRFVQFSIDPYSQNDVSVAFDLPVESGDLVLRDRGYFLLEAISNFKTQGVETISRYKHKTALYDPSTRERLDLLEVLTRSGSVDQIVLAGEHKDIRLRLVAIPVTEEIANLRRMKAKKESNRHAPSQALLRLMSGSIFLLTLENPAITIHEIMSLDGLRWRIENIFKTWKSNFSFSKVHTVSEHQLRILLTARLIMILVCYHYAYGPLSGEILRRSNKSLSLMKFMRYLRQNLDRLPLLLLPRFWNDPLLDALARYCTYDQRKRQHFIAHFDTILDDLAHISA
jgi:hypothetical protein